MFTGGATLDGKDGQPIKSVNEMVLRFSQELLGSIPEWKARLREAPDELEELEREVHAACARGADFVVAGLVSVISMESDFHEACDETRCSFAYPLTRGRERKLRVRLLGGLVMWVFTLYCQPRRRWFDNSAEKKPGVYTAAAQFGFGKGVTPGLQSRVARQAALCPSFDFAHEELARSGLDLDIKTVRRISYQCGEGLLRLRRHHLEQWRSGKLPAGTELKGERVTVQIDGGRTKLRGKLKPAPSRKEHHVCRRWCAMDLGPDSDHRETIETARGCRTSRGAGQLPCRASRFAGAGGSWPLGQGTNASLPGTPNALAKRSMAARRGGAAGPRCERTEGLGNLHPDRLSREARQRGAVELPPFSHDWNPAGERRHRKHDPTRDQPTLEGQRPFMVSGERRSHASTSSPSCQPALGRSAQSDEGLRQAGCSHRLDLGSAIHEHQR